MDVKPKPQELETTLRDEDGAGVVRQEKAKDAPARPHRRPGWAAGTTPTVLQAIFPGGTLPQ